MQPDEWLSRISALPGPSGYERIVCDEISHILQPFFHQVEADSLQNMYLWRFCGRKDAPRVMLAIHIDEVGLYVHSIEPGGFLRVRAIGGVDARILPAQEWTVWPVSRFSSSLAEREFHARGIPAVSGMKPPHLTGAEEREQNIPIHDCFLDLGLSEEVVRETISPGDPVTAGTRLRTLLNGRISGKSLDNRTCTAVLYELCRRLGPVDRDRPVPAEFDFVTVLTTQEELGLHGAQVAAERVAPDAAIVCDVGFGDMPGQDTEDSIVLGGGPALTHGPNIHPGLRRKLLAAAKAAGIPIQFELAAGSTGTDAWVVQTARAGVATALLSVPLRYMHTPVETIDREDMTATARLLELFIRNTTAGEVLSWNPKPSWMTGSGN